jgi:hypothetical protein
MFCLFCYWDSSPTVVGLIKSIRMRWAWHLARMGDGRGVYRVSVGMPEGKRPLARSGVCGRIILRWNLGKRDVGVWTGLGWLRIETGGEHS